MSSNSTTTNNSSSGTQSTLFVDAGDSNLITINPAAQLPLKLTTTNFLSWRSQLFTLLMGLDLIGYPDGTLAAPAKTIGDAPNTAYKPCFRQDKLLLYATFGFVSESILSYIVVVVTANEAWVILQNMFANRSRSRLMIQKNDQSVATNLQKMKNLAAELSLVQCPVPEEDLVIHVFVAWVRNTGNFSAAIRARDSSITIEDLHDKMLEFEAGIATIRPRSTASPTTTYNTQRNHRVIDIGRGRRDNRDSRGLLPSPVLAPLPSQADNSRRSRSSLIFQFCDKPGHTAKKCFCINPQPCQAHYTVVPAAPPPPPSSWLVDSASTNHVTSDLGDLALYSD
ncbi:unnamed protein product [Linum trigynum]|uniref:Retrotransposon Copia-like N-terminal domain-containing protein n=1 Tax=Linum trigynum TaxID=586398 RepID=A0AAV2F9B3_9ROSI